MNVNIFEIEHDEIKLQVQAEWEKISDTVYHVYVTCFCNDGTAYGQWMPSYWLNDRTTDLITMKIEQELDKRNV